MPRDPSFGTPVRAASAQPTEIVIRPEPADAGQVPSTYQAGLDTDQAVFETTAPNGRPSTGRISSPHRIVAANADRLVLGWATTSPVSARCSYVEVTSPSCSRTALIPGSSGSQPRPVRCGLYGPLRYR
jgi:hypothetical protein